MRFILSTSQIINLTLLSVSCHQRVFSLGLELMRTCQSGSIFQLVSGRLMPWMRVGFSGLRETQMIMARPNVTVSNQLALLVCTTNVKIIGTQFRFLVKQPNEKQLVFPNNIPKVDVPYLWHRLGFSTYWKPLNHVVLCFDLPLSLIDSLKASIPASTARLHLDDPFSFHSLLMEGVIELFNAALWSWRNLIRNMEKV
jgi:hypothetical protein